MQRRSGISCVFLSVLSASSGCTQEDEWEDAGPPAVSDYALEEKRSSLRGIEFLTVTDRTSPADWLAAVETDSEPPPASQVRRFEAILRRVDPKFHEDTRMIGNRTVQLHRMLTEEGIMAGLLDILRGLERIGGDTQFSNYGELCAHYFNLRASGRSHQQTVMVLHASRTGGSKQ